MEGAGAARPGCRCDQCPHLRFEERRGDRQYRSPAVPSSTPSPLAEPYFPAGTYGVNGPNGITKLVTLVGESGTIFDARVPPSYVFTINRGGSPISGMTVTGLVIEGPGIETNPAMIRLNLQNCHVSYVKFHNVGYAANRINPCTDATVEHCVFDNVFQTGYGYGVCICERCDRILIRDNFFLTKGRHSVTTGTSQTFLPAADYVRQVIFENNYCENTTDRAADTHAQTVGPYIVPK